jgi:hypothetical protein
MTARDISGSAAQPIVRLFDVHKSFGAVEVQCSIAFDIGQEGLIIEHGPASRPFGDPQTQRTRAFLDQFPQ